MDGVVLLNKTPEGSATQPTWASPSSLITKVYSKGNTQTDEGKLAEMNEKTRKNLAYFRLDQDGLVFDKQFDGVYVINFDDGTQIVLHDPSAAGWTYQTFAHYIDPKGHVYQGYQSLGDETVFTTLPAKGTATYKGISTAYVVTDKNNRQLTSMSWLSLISASKVSVLKRQTHTSILGNGKRVSEADKNYDFKGTASWKDGNPLLRSSQHGR